MPLLPRDLKEFLAPFKILGNRHALSPMYKCLEISEHAVKGCSNVGVLEVVCSLGLDKTVYVDTSTFLSIIDSLPQEQELVLADMDGLLVWSCGSAKGKLALVVIDGMPVINRPKRNDSWDVPAPFAAALKLGAMSCDGTTLTSGMNGVCIDNRHEYLEVYTSDNVTVSCVTLADTHIEGAPELITISADAAELLAFVISKGGVLDVNETSVYYHDAGCRLLLKQVTPLKHDLAAVLANFSKCDVVAAIPNDRITSFIKRTAALSETKKTTHVTLHADHGQLALSFAESLAGSDEYYLVEGLVIPDLLEIKLDANKLARALSHVDEVVLDHVGKGAVIFRGLNPEFMYMIAGTSQ